MLAFVCSNYTIQHFGQHCSGPLWTGIWNNRTVPLLNICNQGKCREENEIIFNVFFTHVYVWCVSICSRVWVHAHACGGQRLLVSSFTALHFIYFRQGILWNPELTDSASLASQPILGTPCPCISCLGWLVGFHGSIRDLDSSPHVCVASLYPLSHLRRPTLNTSLLAILGGRFCVSMNFHLELPTLWGLYIR